MQCKARWLFRRVAVTGVFPSSPPNSINSFDAVIHSQECPSHKRFLVGCSSPFMRLPQHLPGLQAVPAWSMKNRRARTRHFREARVYDHTTINTAMHDMTMDKYIHPTSSRARRDVGKQQPRGRQFNVNAMPMCCQCDVNVMSIQCQCSVNVMQMQCA